MKSTKWVGAAASALGLAVLALAGGGIAAETAPPPITPPPGAAAQSDSSLSTAASGEVLLAGDPHAQACQEAAKFGDFNGTGIDMCSLALAVSLLSNHDRAATLTDRGAIRMQHKQFALAKADFDAALALDPNLANAYADRGGALIAEKRYAEAIADIDRGLALNPDEPHKVWFNRAIADEGLKDLKTALADYQKALDLKPDWAPAKAEIARFNTTTINAPER
jgi:tetratricopeptide (TPR) repeat protein